ncbi:hypothetical protein PVAP13_2NG547503 [Panicum virgatum]|uniref:Uncharacterized protein n=1 Tax=Panicum virgatum TaxID=38727 RepID=A0A8T0VSN4_PANVG|nr:hypothetical protein PVAP13_2NG547503 [Panicum virgatum]
MDLRATTSASCSVPARMQACRRSTIFDGASMGTGAGRDWSSGAAPENTQLEAACRRPQPVSRLQDLRLYNVISRTLPHTVTLC